MKPWTPEDGLRSKDYSDFELEAEGIPTTPTTFKVEVADDKEHLRFTFHTQDGLSKKRTSTYRVYFVDGGLVPPAGLEGTVPDPLPSGVRKHLGMVESLLAASVLVGSIDKSPKGGESTFLNRDFVGADGYFFGVAANLMGQESPPSPPVYNPSITHTAAQSAVPGDVTEAQAAFTSVESGGRMMLQIVVAARPPANDEAFAGYQIYYQNYQNSDPTFMSYTRSQFFKNPSTPSASGLLTGQFIEAPDTPPVYNVGTVDITHGYNNAYKSTGSVAVWSAGWALSRRIQIIQGSDPTLARVDLPISSMNLTASPQYIGTPTVIGHHAGDWESTKGAPYAVYLKGTTGMDGNVVAPHKVRLLFVALSHAGTHRSDILDSVGTPLVPYVEFPWGFTASLGMPLNPSGFTATAQGVTATLSWYVVTSGSIDTTIRNFNLYKARAGTYKAHTVQTRPVVPFATVTIDHAFHADGYYSYTDRDFNILEFNADGTANLEYDLRTSDLGYYTYWITSVSVDGLENPGIVTTDFTCMGNTGGETDPSVNRDSVFNRLYNSPLFIQSAAIANVSLKVLFTHVYTSAAGLATQDAATDGQIVWTAFNPNYKDGQVRNLGGSDGGYDPLTGPENYDDSFSVWQYYMTGAGSSVKFRYKDGAFSGEVILDSGTTTSGIAALAQYTTINKFAPGENLWVTAYLRSIADPVGSTRGLFLMGVRLYDSTLGPELWTERDHLYMSFSTVAITTVRERFTFGLTLPTSGVGVWDRVATYFWLQDQPNANMTVGVSSPMVNGGKAPAQYTPIMDSEDYAGGRGVGDGLPELPPRCVTGDTFIKTANGSQLAKDIREGATVFSWTKQGRLPNKVDKVVGTQAKTIIHLSTNGAHLYCTPTHKVAVRKTARIAYVKADALELGDVIITSDGFQSVDRAIEVKEILHLQTPVDVYDFHLERDPHNYIASGVVCHNKQFDQEVSP